MSAADLRDAFNAVSEPRFSCQWATLSYEPGDGIQYQRLDFYGLNAAGAPFSVRSDRLAPNTDVNKAAAAVAQALLEKDAAP